MRKRTIFGKDDSRTTFIMIMSNLLSNEYTCISVSVGTNTERITHTVHYSMHTTSYNTIIKESKT